MNHSIIPTIRQCTAADVEALSALARGTFFDTFNGTCHPDDMQAFLDEFYNIERMSLELATDNPPSFFALVDGVPAGYISFAVRPPQYPVEAAATKAIELIRLYVNKQYHGAGIAHTLMQFYIDKAKEQGCNYLWLGVWEHNLRAQKFYTKYGFSYTGHTHPFPIGLTPQTDQWWAKHI